MAFSPAAKVGAATLAGLLATGAGFAWLTSFSFGPHGYSVDVVYQDVAGLLQGANVMLMGVKIGKVDAIVPEDRVVHVKLHVLNPKTHILQGSRFKIMSQGIIGEKSIEIFPPIAIQTSAGYIHPGDQLRGDDPQRIELVMEEMTNTFNEFKESVDPKQFQELFNKTAQNLYETTETVKRIGVKGEGLIGDVSGSVKGIDRLVADADMLVANGVKLAGAARPEDVRAVVTDMRQLTAGLRATYEDFFGTRSSRSQNAAALKNLRGIIDQLNKLAGALNNVTGDEHTQSDVKSIIKNLNALTRTVNGATNVAQQAQNFQGFKISPRLQGVAAQTPTGTGLAGNLGLRVDFGTNYATTGLEQIGEGNYLNLAFGSERAWGPAGYHFGLIRSKIGVGIDYELTPSVSLMGQLYDPFRPTFRLGTTFFPLAANQYGILAQWARTIQTNENFLWLGVEWRPLNQSEPSLPQPPR